MSKQRHRRRSQGGTTPETRPQTGSGVAHFSVSEVAQFSMSVDTASGAICRSRLLTVTTSLRQQERDIWQFLEQAWIAHHRRGVMPSLLPVP